MTKKERVAIFKKKAIEPYLQQLNESEAKYRHERRISAYFWNKWKQDNAKHVNDMKR